MDFTLDVERGALGSILWPDADLTRGEKVVRLRPLSSDELSRRVTEALRQHSGRWALLPGWVFWRALRRIFHHGDTPDEAYRWARRLMTERPGSGPEVGPCLVWVDPPPDRHAWIPNPETLSRLRSEPGRWALVHVLTRRAGIEAASRVRRGKVAYWLDPAEWEAKAGRLDGKDRGGLWLRFERRRQAADVDVDRRQAEALNRAS